MSRADSENGQATVELIALVPVVAAVALALLQLLAAGVAGELADHAAEAGAVALLEGDDPVHAARSSLPGWTRDRLTLRVDGRTVHVRLRPLSPVGAVADLLAASSTAVAGAG